MSAFQNYFIDVFKYKYADFEGRARRSEYWYFLLFTYITMFALMGIMFLFIGTGLRDESILGMIIIAILLIFLFAMVIPSIALTVRRLHDSGKSGWWYLIAFVPLGSLVLIIFMFLDSEPHTNQWGPNPKNPSLEGDITDHLLEDEIV